MSKTPAQRTTTAKGRFNRTYKLGDKFILRRQFGNSEEIVKIVSILPSGKFFKVSGHQQSFSIETLHSRGSSITSGYYLIPM
jgi:hypothetical protein